MSWTLSLPQALDVELSLSIALNDSRFMNENNKNISWIEYWNKKCTNLT